MKVVLICDQQDLIASMRAQFQQRIETVTQVPVNWRAIGESVDLQDMLVQQQADYIICAVALAQAAPAEDFAHYASIVKQCVDYSKKHQAALIFLSSASVFKPGMLSYSESDQCEPPSTMAAFYLAQEEFVAQSLARHIILRISWMYSADEGNFLTSVVQHASDDNLISFNSAGKGCPTSVHDVARVLMAILLQLDVGAEAWGLFHYGSSDAAIGFQFVESIVALASQYDANINARNLRFEHNDDVDGLFYFEPIVLNCQKLLNTYGIHQKPWRGLLEEVVKDCFAEVAE